jgi:RNA polymerase sigma-70 factor (ECF subfamily)
VRERELVGRFAAAVELGDTDGVISLLTDDAWLTMPPQPYEYQGPQPIAGFIVHERGERAGANLRLVPTRANGQPAFGCYLPDPHAVVSRAYGLMVLTLAEDKLSAITWFGERSLLQHFGLPTTLAD